MATKRPVQRARRRALLGGVGLIGAALGALASPRRTAARDDDDGIIGVWLIRGGRSGSFVYMLCFLPGGIVQYLGPPTWPTTRPDDDPGALEYRSVAAGQWVRTGFGEYTFTGLRIVYDPPANATGLDSYKSTVRYDPLADTIETTFSESVRRNLAGEVIATLPGGSSQGTRVTVQPQL